MHALRTRVHETLGGAGEDVVVAGRVLTPSTAAATTTSRPECVACGGEGTLMRPCVHEECRFPFHAQTCPECHGSGSLRPPRKVDAISRAVDQAIASMCLRPRPRWSDGKEGA